MKDWETITPYKNRALDYRKTVQVYRCLTRKGKVYSIKQNGKVVAHATHLSMKNCKFVVNKAGNLRCKERKERNVHAYIQGTISKSGIMGMDAFKDDNALPAKISYNPYSDESFMCENLAVPSFKVLGAGGVLINEQGVTAAHIY